MTQRASMQYNRSHDHLGLRDRVMYNLLTEELVRFNHSDGSRCPASLPEVYAALMADKVDSFPALRPHQRHSWHAFLVQLGVMAVQRAGRTDLPEDHGAWRETIRELTPEFPDDEPWQLVVDDITKPAFMQPPASSKANEEDYKNPVFTPDELDMLVTSKNHDLKAIVAANAQVDDWLFALIALQTMEGFGGQGNYGISRMNGGLGNRPAFSLAPAGHSPGGHIKRDIGALMEGHQAESRSKIALLWTLPWDGTPTESLLLNRLHPLYVEVCRRIRLDLGSEGQLQGRRATSRVTRLESKALKGRTGDPWTPVDMKREGVPLTLGSGGFTYKRIKDYLFEWARPTLLEPTENEKRSRQDMHLVAKAIVRGQGKTEGYYDRTIPFRNRTFQAFGTPGGPEQLGGIARKRVEEISTIQRILRYGIQVFTARGNYDKISTEHREMARPWLNRLDEIVDASFFDDLQDEFEATTNERQGIHNKWLMNGKDGVVDHARDLLGEATDTLPCPAIYRHKARVRAEVLFEGRMRGNKGLPFLFDQQNKETKEE